ARHAPTSSARRKKLIPCIVWVSRGPCPALPERLARLRKALLAQRPANVALLRHRDTRLRSIFRRHVRESDLTSPVPFGSPYAQFEARPPSRPTRQRTSMLRYCDSINSANRGEHCAQPHCRGRECGSMHFLVDWSDKMQFFSRDLSHSSAEGYSGPAPQS